MEIQDFHEGVVLKLSTRGRYAVRILMRLAANRQTAMINVQEIASEEGISPHYVEQILMRLKTAGLAVSRRGTRGGFATARDPDTITVSEVLDAVEGPIELAPCATPGCARRAQCGVSRLWIEASAALRGMFDGKTVGMLAREGGLLRTAENIGSGI